MKNWVYLRIVLLAAALPVVLFLMSDQAAAQDWLNIALTSHPVTKDPAEIEDFSSGFILQNNVFECLVRHTREKKILEPGLATEWHVENNGKEWIFKIREDVLFHDGTAMTARDVVRSVKRSDFYNGEVTAEGRFTVRFTLPDKRAEFIKSLSMVQYSVVKLDDEGRLIGTGPFFIESWDPKNRVVLKSFRSYWSGRASLAGVIYFCGMDAREAVNRMRTGEIDLIDTLPPEMADAIAADDELVLSELQGANLSFVHLNINNPPLDRPEFRKALNMAINKEKIIRDIYYGHALKSYSLHPTIRERNKKDDYIQIKYHPDRAREIISNFAGEEELVFRFIGLPLPRPYSPDPNAQARLVAGYLKGVGIKLEYYQPESMTEYIRYVESGDYDLLLCGWVIESYNPDDFYVRVLGTEDNLSVFGVNWSDMIFNSLISNARKTISLKKQWEFYMTAEKIFFDECPWIILAHPNRIFAYRSEVRGLDLTSNFELRIYDVNKDPR
jgi:ABC-type transport system substrate-binding protein